MRRKDSALGLGARLTRLFKTLTLPDPGLTEIEKKKKVWMNWSCFFSFFFSSVKVEGVKHSGPTKMVLYFTGATNILYTFGGHAVTV